MWLFRNRSDGSAKSSQQESLKACSESPGNPRLRGCAMSSARRQVQPTEAHQHSLLRPDSQDAQGREQRSLMPSFLRPEEAALNSGMQPVPSSRAKLVPRLPGQEGQSEAISGPQLFVSGMCSNGLSKCVLSDSETKSLTQQRAGERQSACLPEMPGQC